MDNSQLTPHSQHHFPLFAILIAVVTLSYAIAAQIWFYLDYEETKRFDATAVTLKNDLKTSFNQPAKVSDFIANLNGELVEDPAIDTKVLGTQTINFDYINPKNKRRTAGFTIEVVDDVAPLIYGNSIYTVPLGYDGDLTDLMMSGDNLDDQPRREIRGNYDLNKVWNYQLEYVVTDASGNQSKKPFTLKVVRPNNDNSANVNTSSTSVHFSTVKAQHKTDSTKIGIDVSAWQGEINWPAVKAAGVEFVMIRIGYQVGYDGKYVLDKYFTANIEGALAVGLPVGVYFYSYANSIEEAENQAHWVIDQVADYELELGIAFDWENWHYFNQAGVSFYTLNRTAEAFINTVEAAGYHGILYGSKNYLTLIWDLDLPKTWLAQYYLEPTYEGQFFMWQLTSSGRVDGISGNVDLDIMYN